MRELFYAHVLQGLPRIVSDSTPTAAVRLAAGRVELIVNPSFFLGLKADERVALLKHEVLHVVLKHLVRSRDRDPLLWNIACDIVVNELIPPFPLPPGALTRATFPDAPLQPNMTAERIYDVLKHINEERKTAARSAAVSKPSSLSSPPQAEAGGTSGSDAGGTGAESPPEGAAGKERGKRGKRKVGGDGSGGPDTPGADDGRARDPSEPRNRTKPGAAKSAGAAGDRGDGGSGDGEHENSNENADNEADGNSDGGAPGNANERGGAAGVGGPPDFSMTSAPRTAAALHERSANAAAPAGHSDHGGWDGQAGADGPFGKLAEAAIDQLVTRSVERTPAKMWGSLPGSIRAAIEESRERADEKIDWKRTLRLFSARSGRTKVIGTQSRESARYGTFPGTKIKRFHALAVAIDTSGSINDHTLKVFFAEIDVIWRSGSRVLVVLCDAAVHGSFEYKGKVPAKLGGGGGTAFDPVFQWLLDNRRHRVDGCVYLTDGQGPAPKIKPPCPVLWVLTHETPGLPFGRSISIEI